MTYSVAITTGYLNVFGSARWTSKVPTSSPQCYPNAEPIRTALPPMRQCYARKSPRSAAPLKQTACSASPRSSLREKFTGEASTSPTSGIFWLLARELRRKPAGNSASRACTGSDSSTVRSRRGLSKLLPVGERYDKHCVHLFIG